MMKHLKTFGMFLGGLALGGLISYGIFAPRPERAADAEIERLREASVAGVNEAVYRNDRRSFSLGYPKHLSVQEFDEGYGSETILFSTPGQKNGFQIFITPYNDTAITEERIRADVPGGAVSDFVEVVIGENIRAVRFSSELPGIGKTTEVWFIHKGYLYEATTYAAEDAMLAGVLSTLRFDP